VARSGSKADIQHQREIYRSPDIKQLKMRNSKIKRIKLLSVGISTILAEKVLNEGYSLTSLSKTNKKDLIGLFGNKDGSLLFDKSRRKPIQSEVIQQLVEECYWSCCCCQNLDRSGGVVIHHIKHYSNDGGNEYDNLILLCPNHHEDAHSKSTLTQPQYPPEVLVQYKNDWVKTIKEWRDGKRPRPGRKKKGTHLFFSTPKQQFPFWSLKGRRGGTQPRDSFQRALIGTNRTKKEFW